MSKEYTTFLSFIVLEVGNGKATCFWEDKWRGDVLLCEKSRLVQVMPFKEYHFL